MKADISDESMEELLALSNFTQPAELKCEKGNKIVRMCINPKCKQNSLMCQDLECSSCKDDKHHMCLFIRLKDISMLLDESVSRQNQLVNEMNKIQTQLISQLQKAKKTFPHPFEHMKSGHLNLVNQIYIKGNHKCLTGNLAKSFYEALTENLDKQREEIFVKLNSYRRQINELLQSIITLKNELLQISRNSMLFFANSKILGSKMSLTAMERIRLENQENFLKETFKNSSFKLLFRASENQFLASKFHEKCDGIQNTLTLVQTEHGKKIAGFTKEKWTSPSEAQQVTGSAFLVSLDLQDIMKPTEKFTIRRNKNCGPIFGGPNGSDLFIYDCCDKNNKSGAFSGCYFNKQVKPFDKNQETFYSISGCPKGYNFKVIEYEVFEVVGFKPLKNDHEITEQSNSTKLIQLNRYLRLKFLYFGRRNGII